MKYKLILIISGIVILPVLILGYLKISDESDGDRHEIETQVRQQEVIAEKNRVEKTEKVVKQEEVVMEKRIEVPAEKAEEIEITENPPEEAAMMQEAEIKAGEVKEEAAKEADEKAKAGKTAGAAGDLVITVHSVEGVVDYAGVRNDWKPLKAGMILKEGHQISTGFKSKAVLLFGDNSITIVKPLTQMWINKFVKRENKIHTLLKVKVGTMRIHVKKGEIKSDFKVSTPQLTASVRGTVWEINSSRAFGDIVSGFEGRVVAKNTRGRQRSISANEATTNAMIPTIEAARLERTFVALSVKGLSEAEEEAAVENLSEQGSVTPGDLTSTDNPIEARNIEQARVVVQLKPSCSTQ